jgi:rod shape-determining protein MreD
MISRYFKYIIISLLLVVVQTKLMRFISLEGITPDLLTIWIVYFTLQRGQMAGTLWGFAIGLFYDLSMGNFIGLSAFTKTIAGFTAGYFYDEQRTSLTLGSYRFLIVILLVSFIHNIFYFIVYTRGSEISFLGAVFEIGLATTCYTAIVSLLPMFFFARKLIK